MLFKVEYFRAPSNARHARDSGDDCAPRRAASSACSSVVKLRGHCAPRLTSRRLLMLLSCVRQQQQHRNSHTHTHQTPSPQLGRPTMAADNGTRRPERRNHAPASKDMSRRYANANSGHAGSACAGLRPRASAPAADCADHTGNPAPSKWKAIQIARQSPAPTPASGAQK